MQRAEIRRLPGNRLAASVYFSRGQHRATQGFAEQRVVIGDEESSHVTGPVVSVEE